MAYTVEELIARFRSDMDDTATPYLWSDADIKRYLDEAQDAFTDKVDVLRSVETITVPASTAFVAYPEYINRIRSAVNANGKKVQLFNEEEWHSACFEDDYGEFTIGTNWETKTGPEVKALITDLRTGYLRPYPLLDAPGSVKLNVYRDAILSVYEDDEIEVSDRNHQMTILRKARGLAYNKHDSEAYNPQLAREFDDRFEIECLEHQQDVKRRTRRAGTVKYGGY